MSDEYNDQCAICGMRKEDASNLTTKSILLYNGMIGCGHALYVCPTNNPWGDSIYLPLQYIYNLSFSFLKKLTFSFCFLSLVSCPTCIERELSRRKTFPCPICIHIQVKRTKLSEKTLDDILCEKDIECRKRICKVYNKVQSDFDSLLEYNNYLEQVEDMIYALVHEEPNAEDIETRIKKYEEEDKRQIVIRQSQRSDEDRNIADRCVFFIIYVYIWNLSFFPLIEYLYTSFFHYFPIILF